MTYVISKEFAWSSSHVLAGLPDGHQCGRLHGHNYIAKVILTADVLNDVGFVLDYGELGFVKDYIDATWDHRHLNDDLGPLNPTAENLARLLGQAVAARVPADVKVAVAISETPKTWATWTP